MSKQKEVIFPNSAKWWEFRDFDEEEREKIDLALDKNNNKIAPGINFYDNMKKCYKYLGLTAHPLFKCKPDYSKKTNEVNPELGPPLGAPEKLPV